MKNRIILIIIIIFITSVYGYGFTLLDNGFNARAIGLGGAFTALSDDTSALYYNPALLYDFETPQVSVGYARNFLTADKINLAYIQPKVSFKPDIGISAAVSTLLDSGIPGYQPVEYGDAGEYRIGSDIDYYENFFILGGGIKIKNIWMMQLSGGISIQFLNRKIYDFKSYGFGVNLGINSRHRLFDFSVVLKNLFTKIISDNSEENVPIVLRLGTLLRIKRIFNDIFGDNDKQPTLLNNTLVMQNIIWRINPVFDIEFVFDNKVQINGFAGIEGWLNNIAALRFGYNSYQGLSCGTSINIDRIRVDYTYSIHSELAASHRVTATYYF